MENLKIRVNNEAESKEAMALFKILGGMRPNSAFDDRIGIVAMEFGEIYVDNSCHWGAYDGKETTLDQLRQMVADKTTSNSLLTPQQAKLAWANGGEVQVSHKHATLKKEWHDLYGTLMLSAFDSDMYEFRLKPRTITINNIEIPAPFEPKKGERYWWINPNAKTGYAWDSNDLEVTDFNRISIGVYRTEEQIKQVVAALRSILNAKP